MREELLAVRHNVESPYEKLDSSPEWARITKTKPCFEDDVVSALYAHIKSERAILVSYNTKDKSVELMWNKRMSHENRMNYWCAFRRHKRELV